MVALDLVGIVVGCLVAGLVLTAVGRWISRLRAPRLTADDGATPHSRFELRRAPVQPTTPVPHDIAPTDELAPLRWPEPAVDLVGRAPHHVKGRDISL